MANADDFAASIGAEPEEDDFAASIGAEPDAAAADPAPAAKTTTFDEDLAAIAARHGVDEDYLRSASHGMGYYDTAEAERNIQDGVTGNLRHLKDGLVTAGNSLVGEGMLGGLPSFVNKKLLADDAEEAALDELRASVDKRKNGFQSATESIMSGGIADKAIKGVKALDLGAKTTKAVSAGVNVGDAARIQAQHSKDGEEGDEALFGAGLATAAEALPIVGKPFAAAGRWVGNKVDDLGRAISGKAERGAFKAAIGNQGKIYDEAVERGQVNDIGRQLLDEEIVTFGTNAATIADRAKAAKKEVGGRMGDVLNSVDEGAEEAGQRVGKWDFPVIGKVKAAPTDRVDGRQIAAQIRAHAQEVAAPNNEALVENLMKQADRFDSMGAMTLEQAHKLKTKAYRYKFGDPATMALGQDATNTINQIIGDEMENAIGRADVRSAARSRVVDDVQTGSGSAQVRDFPPTGDGTGAVLREAEAAAPDAIPAEGRRALYEELKRKYGPLKVAAKGAQKQATRFEKNSPISMSDMLFAGFGGVSTEDPETGLALGALNNLRRKRGSSAAAVGLDKLGKILKAAPETFGRFAAPLQEAASRGNQALAVTHFLMLSQDPEYRRQVLGDEQ